MARMAETRRTPGLDRFLKNVIGGPTRKIDGHQRGDISEELYYLERVGLCCYRR